MLPEGFEPPITVPKTVVISVSLREHRWLSYFFFCCADTSESVRRSSCHRRDKTPPDHANHSPGNRPRLEASPSRVLGLGTGSRFAPLGSHRSAVRFPAAKCEGTSLIRTAFAVLMSVRIRGIEPRSPPWQGGVLPLNHIRAIKRADYTAHRSHSNATYSSARPCAPSSALSLPPRAY